MLLEIPAEDVLGHGLVRVEGLFLGAEEVRGRLVSVITIVRVSKSCDTNAQHHCMLRLSLTLFAFDSIKRKLVIEEQKEQ